MTAKPRKPALKPVLVTVTKGRHKKQPYSFSIDKPGPARQETRTERYSTDRNAVRAAMRILGAKFYPRVDNGEMVTTNGGTYPVDRWYIAEEKGLREVQVIKR
jgi:hypothetical protein